MSEANWESVVVDRGWPATWEWQKNGRWYTLEKLPDGYRLWDLPRRAAYDYGRKCGMFPSMQSAAQYVLELL